jgi:hypothetical protein
MSCLSSGKCLIATTLTRADNGASEGAIVEVGGAANGPVFIAAPKAPYVFSSITGVSCSSATTCFATAYKTTRDGIERPMLLESKAPFSTWQPVSGLQYPSGSVALNSISCNTGGACGVGGVWHNAGANVGVIAVETGSHWLVNTVNDYTGGGNLGYESVACADSFCYFGGQLDFNYEIYAYNLSTGAGTVATTPAPVTSGIIESSTISSIWCSPSSNPCIGVGSTYDLTTSQEINIAVSDSSGTWALINPISPLSNTLASSVGSISCQPNLTNCAMIASGYGSNLVLLGTPGKVFKQGLQNTNIRLLKCESTGQCLGVGVQGDNPLIQIFDLSSPQSTMASASPTTGQGGELADLSCPTASSCFAAGSSYTNLNLSNGTFVQLSRPLIFSLAQGSVHFVPMSVPNPETGSTAEAPLYFISCSDANTCYAVGVDYKYGSAIENSYLEVLKNGTWSLGPSIPAVAGATNQDPVGFSCNHTTCVLAEEPVLTNGKATLAFYALTGGVWKALALPSGLSNDRHYFNISQVTCSPSSCLVVGSVISPLGYSKAVVIRATANSLNSLNVPNVAGEAIPTVADSSYCSARGCVVDGAAEPANALNYPWLAVYPNK